MAEPSSTSSKWPGAAPPEGQQTILTVSCGNTRLYWGVHDNNGGNDNNNNNDSGASSLFAPSMFWRTPHISDADMKDFPAVQTLSRMVPDNVHNYIFGTSTNDAATTKDVTEQMAVDQSQKRAVEDISIYVVSTNQDQLNKLQTICASIPSKLIVMEGDDFFREDQGRYNGMGVDRLATLTGAVHFHGHPALVFDGGTATTYSATNREGMVLGGGIGPGILSKLQSMSKDTDALPSISPEEVTARVKETLKSGQPLPTFARNTNDAMMVDVFQEFAGKGRNVIENWIEHAYPKYEGKPSPSSGKYNEDRIVVVTGGDGDIFYELLQPHHGGVIEASNKEASNGKKREYQVEPRTHLIHYGIVEVLNVKIHARRNMNKSIDSGENYIGKRVAKVFDVESDDGDNVFRGSVTEDLIIDGVKVYRIVYDDGDEEDVTLKALMDMFKLYKQRGEANSFKGKKENGVKPKAKAANKPQASNAEPSDPNKEASERLMMKTKSKPAADAPKKTQEAPKFPMKEASKKHASGSADDGNVPASKKAKTNGDIKHRVRSEPNSFVNKRVAKDFDGDCFFGKITKYDDSELPAFWHVVYDDGDEEDYSARDLINALKYYEKHRKDDKSAGD